MFPSPLDNTALVYYLAVLTHCGPAWGAGCSVWCEHLYRIHCEVSEANIQAECVILQCGLSLCVTGTCSYPTPSLYTEPQPLLEVFLTKGQIHSLLSAKTVSESKGSCSQAGRLWGPRTAAHQKLSPGLGLSSPSLRHSPLYACIVKDNSVSDLPG